MKIDEVLAQYEDYLKVSTNSSVNTIRKYYSIARRFLLDMNMSFTLDDINRWLAKENEKKNVYAYRYAIKHLLHSIGRNDLANKIKSTKRHKRKKTFPFIHKKKMEKVINQLPSFFRKIAFLQIKTGARVTEILTIRNENFDFNISDKFIYAKIGVGKSHTKGSKENTIKLSKRYEDMISRWMKKPYGFMFLNNEFENMDEETFYRKVDTIRRRYDEELRKAGNWFNIEGLSSHYLRYLFADYFLMAGGNVEDLKKAFNHEKIETTLGYVSIQDKRIEDTLEKMEDEI